MTGGRDRRRGDRRRQPDGEPTPSVPWWERRFGQEAAPTEAAGPPDERPTPNDGWPRPNNENPQPDLDVSALRQSAGTGGYRGRPDQVWQGEQPRQPRPQPPQQPQPQQPQPQQPQRAPGASGEYPRATGEHPRATGEHPRATGEYPRTTGEYPRTTGEHQVAGGERPRPGPGQHQPAEPPGPYGARTEPTSAHAQHQAPGTTTADHPAAPMTDPGTDRRGPGDSESGWFQAATAEPTRSEATHIEPEPTPATERTTGSHSRVPARSRRLSLPTLAVRPLDLQVLTWWFLTRVSLLVIAISAPSLFRPDDGAPGFLERWGNWDVAHFAQIANNGYFQEEWETPVEAFFPGLPLIMRLGLVIGLSPVLTGMVVSLLAGGVAAVALARLAESEYGEGAGQKAALAWMVAPPGVFLAAPYTEALFLGFAIPAWLAARRGHWWLAGALTFGACSVRVSGIFLLIALGVEFLTSKRRGSWENAGWLALPLVPLLAYMAYLWANTGDALRWYNAQAEGWYREFHWPWEALLNTVRAAQGEGYGAPDAAMHANWEWMFRAELGAMLLGVVVTVVLLTMRRWSEATWIGVQLAAFSTSTWFFSVPRATLLWFPLWIGLGALASTRPWIWRGYVVIAAPLFGLWASAFLLGKWAG